MELVVQEALLDMPGHHLEFMVVGLNALHVPIPAPRLVQKVAEFYTSQRDFGPFPGSRVRNTIPLKNIVDKVAHSYPHVLLLPLRGKLPTPLHHGKLPRPDKENKYSLKQCLQVLQLSEAVADVPSETCFLNFLKNNFSWPGLIPALLLLSKQLPDPTALLSGTGFGISEMVLVLATKCTTAPEGKLENAGCWLQVARVLLTRAQAREGPPGLQAPARPPEGFLLALSLSVNVLLAQPERVATPLEELVDLAVDVYTFALSQSHDARFNDMKSEEIAEHPKFCFRDAVLDKLNVPGLLKDLTLDDWCVDPRLAEGLAVRVSLQSLLDDAAVFQRHPLGRLIVVHSLTTVLSTASRASLCITPQRHATSHLLLGLQVFAEHAGPLAHHAERVSVHLASGVESSIAVEIRVETRLAALQAAYHECRKKISAVACDIASGCPEVSMRFAEKEVSAHLMAVLHGHRRIALGSSTALKATQQDITLAGSEPLASLPSEQAVECRLQELARIAAAVERIAACHESVLKLFGSAALSSELIHRINSFARGDWQRKSRAEVEKMLDGFGRLWKDFSGALVHEMHLIKQCCPQGILSGAMSGLRRQEPMLSYADLMSACAELRSFLVDLWRRLEADDLALEVFSDERMTPEVLQLGHALSANAVPDVRACDVLCTEVPPVNTPDALSAIRTFGGVRSAAQLVRQVRELSAAAQIMQVRGADSLHALTAEFDVRVLPPLQPEKREGLLQLLFFQSRRRHLAEQDLPRAPLASWEQWARACEEVLPADTAAVAAHPGVRALGHCQPLMEWLESSMLVDDGAFREFLERGMDLAALDGSLARALQDLRKARGGLLGLKNAELPEFLQTLEYVDPTALEHAVGGLSMLQGLHRELTQSASDRVIHKLDAMETGTLAVCAAEKLFLPVSQAGACVSMHLDGGRAMSAEACEEVFSQLSMGELSDAALRRVEVFSAALQAAVKLAAEVLGARLLGEPRAQAAVDLRFFCGHQEAAMQSGGHGELPGTSACPGSSLVSRLDAAREEWRQRRGQWRDRLREKQAHSLQLASLPIRVALARSMEHATRWDEHYLSDAWSSAPAQFKDVAPPPVSAAQGELLTWAPPGQPVAYVAGAGHQGSAFTLLLDLFRRAVNRLPFRSEVLLCTSGTTATDVDAFVIRVLSAPGLLHAVVRPEELSAGLQHRLLAKLAKWRAPSTRPRWLHAPPSERFHLLAVGGAGAGGVLLEHFEHTELQAADARLSQVTVTLCGEAGASSLQQLTTQRSSTANACVLRIGRAVTGPIESLLFEFLVLQCVVGAKGEVIPRLWPTYVETDTVLGFCTLLPTTWVMLAGESHPSAATGRQAVGPGLTCGMPTTEGVTYIETTLTKRPELRFVMHALGLQALGQLGTTWEQNFEAVRTSKKLPMTHTWHPLGDLVQGGACGAVPYTILVMVTLHMFNMLQLIEKGMLSMMQDRAAGFNLDSALRMAKHTAWQLVGEEYAPNQPASEQPNLDFMRAVCPTAPAVAALHRLNHNFVYSAPLAEKLLAVKLQMDISTPVVIEGHTGCGKTTLVERLCELEGRRLIHIRVHGGYHAARVQRELREALVEAGRYHRATGRKVVLFLDEVNTSPAVDLLKDFICDHRIEGAHVNEILGGKGEEALCVVSAINPYQERTQTEVERFRHMGLRVMAHTGAPGGGADLARLVYRVHPLPPTLEHYVYRFGDMPRDLEATCIREQLSGLPNELARAAAVAHFFMRSSAESDSRFVSFRDVKHCREVFQFAASATEGLALPVTAAAAVAVSVAYAAKLEKRRPLYELLAHEGGLPTARADFRTAQQRLLEDMTVPEGVCVNEALAENVFMMVVAIQLQRPLFVVGPPGSSKSLAKVVVSGSMLGPRSTAPLLRRLRCPQLRTLQCSPHTSTADLEGHFAAAQDVADAVVVLEEVGLAEMSPEMPLKLLHERFDAEEARAFLGLSNWQLDPAKMNRCLFVARSMPTAEEMVATASKLLGGAGLVGQGPLHALCGAFLEVAVLMAAKPEFPEGAFYALRDIYGCVKLLAKHVDADLAGGLWLPSLMRAVHRNFAGLPAGPQAEVDALFAERLGAALEVQETAPVAVPRPGGLVLAREAFDAPGAARYPLVICQQPVVGALAGLRARGMVPEGAHVLCGSGFRGDRDARYLCKVVKEIKQCLAAGQALVLVNLDAAYESLYDMLNKFYTKYNGRSHVDISMGTGMVMKAEVHDDFRCVVLASAEDAYAKFPPPLLNRFEKHRHGPGDVDETAAAVMLELRAWAAEELEDCVGVDLGCDESLAALLGACGGSLETAQQALQHMDRAPRGMRSSLELLLSHRAEGAPAVFVTVADPAELRDRLTLLTRASGHVCVHVGDYDMHEQFVEAIEHAAGSLQPVEGVPEAASRYVIISIETDDPKLFADVDHTLRGAGVPQLALVTAAQTRRPLDGYWAHAHVDTVRREAWRGLDEVLDGSLHDAMAAIQSDVVVTRLAENEVDKILYRRVEGMVRDQVLEDEGWASRWARTSPAVSAAVDYVIEQITGGLLKLRLDVWARECAMLQAFLDAGDDGSVELWCHLAERSSGAQSTDGSFAFSDVLQRMLDGADFSLPLQEVVASGDLPAVTLPAQASLKYLQDIDCSRGHVAYNLACCLFQDELARLVVGHVLMRYYPGEDAEGCLTLDDTSRLCATMTAQEVWGHVCGEEDSAVAMGWLEDDGDIAAAEGVHHDRGVVPDATDDSEGGCATVSVEMGVGASSMVPCTEEPPAGSSASDGAFNQAAEGRAACGCVHTARVTSLDAGHAASSLLDSDRASAASCHSASEFRSVRREAEQAELGVDPAGVARAKEVLNDIVALLEPRCDDLTIACSLRHLGGMVGRAVAVLATDLSTASASHFVFELLQNFEDNRYPPGAVPRVAIVQQGDGPHGGLLFANNEVGFSEADVRSLCNIGNSTKKGCRGFIGEKGLGFKAVFSVCRAPMIVSGGYRFKFDLDSGSALSHLLPVPLSAAEVTWLLGMAPAGEEWTTLIFLPHAPALAVDCLDPVTLLFFHKLQELEVRERDATVDGGTRATWRKDVRDAPVVRLMSERRSMRFTVVTQECSVEGHASAERAHVAATEVVLAFPHHEPAHGARCQVYNFLPVRDVGLPFIVNMDLLLTAAREDIHGDADWNVRLRQQLPRVFCAALDAFKAPAASGIPRAFLEFVPCRRRVSHPFFAPVVPEILAQVRELECVRTWDGGWVQPAKAVWCPEPRVQRFLAQELDLPNTVGVHVAVGLEGVSRETGNAAGLQRVNLDWALESVVARHAVRYADAPDSLFLSLLELRDDARHGCLCRCALWPVEGGGGLARAANLVVGAGSNDDGGQGKRRIRASLQARLTGEQLEVLQSLGAASNQASTFGLLDRLARLSHDDALEYLFQHSGELRSSAHELGSFLLRTQAGTMRPASQLYLSGTHLASPSSSGPSSSSATEAAEAPLGLHEAVDLRQLPVAECFLQSGYPAEYSAEFFAYFGVSRHIQADPVNGVLDRRVTTADVVVDVPKLLRHVDAHWEKLRPALARGGAEALRVLTVRVGVRDLEVPLRHCFLRNEPLSLSRLGAYMPWFPVQLCHVDLRDALGIISVPSAKDVADWLRTLEVSLPRTRSREEADALLDTCARAYTLLSDQSIPRDNGGGIIPIYVPPGELPGTDVPCWHPPTSCSWEPASCGMPTEEGAVLVEPRGALRRLYPDGLRGFFLGLGVRGVQPLSEAVRHIPHDREKLYELLRQLNEGPREFYQDAALLPIVGQEALALPSRDVVVCDQADHDPVGIAEACPGLLLLDIPFELLPGIAEIVEPCRPLSELLRMQQIDSMVDAALTESSPTDAQRMRAAPADPHTAAVHLVQLHLHLTLESGMVAERVSTLQGVDLHVGGGYGPECPELYIKVHVAGGCEQLADGLPFYEVHLVRELGRPRPHHEVLSTAGAACFKVPWRDGPWYCAYAPGSAVLLLGEGNFSFAAALCKLRSYRGAGILATSPQPPEQDCQRHLELLRRCGAEVRHDVDATALSTAILPSNDRRFDFVVFNFPHTGARQTGTSAAQMLHSVQSNRALLCGLFRTASAVLHPYGRLHVTIKTTAPYTSWRLPELAAAEGWQCLRAFAFPAEQFHESGYYHQTTMNLSIAVRLSSAHTYEFVRCD
ncbi:hypothetical protein CYMTET_51899 [Cymbomonas tetramitiformis]|uniref:AAA+ ATPase domain-containing protein n=1 Tax=Cymbomonas tetramitiformis TaxID=36881 RepID=A0AAE0BLA1_9CHLO|nr:hypothetical protein CYMTET_51899 [Cymbomonas tetramitiformis]